MPINLLLKKSYCLFAITAFAVCMLFLTAGKSTPATTNLVISIKHYNGVSLLKLDDAQYLNVLGQTYTVSKFRYYIGNIQLKKNDGTVYTSNGYYLIDEDNEASKQIALKDIPAGDYKAISFIIGVDSLHNCSGAQSDALDPVNGMFWTWSTGYIFLKLEGHAQTSLSPGHIFEYHIGGYVSPHNCIRTISLSLGQKGLHVLSGSKSELTLKADVAAILKSPYKVDFSKLSSVTDFHNSTTIADNYSHMFSIIAQ